MLLQGDCLEQLAHIPDGCVDMCFSDLPYGVTANKWDSVIPFEPLWNHLLRVGKKNCAFVFTATQPFATSLINSQPKLFRYDLIWEKNRPGRFVHAKRMPLSSHETLLIFYRPPCTYNAQMVTGETYSRKHSNYKRSNGSCIRPGKRALPDTVYEGRYPRSILRISKDEKTVHPTQKPVALLEWLIKTYSTALDIILDPVMGSGSTGVAW
jgi:site-specific DNA-methyltransferase (adenine-specific)